MHRMLGASQALMLQRNIAKEPHPEELTADQGDGAYGPPIHGQVTDAEREVTDAERDAHL